jgi:HPt (histidine-containing phosphotransfer) domain-containing protein
LDFSAARGVVETTSDDQNHVNSVLTFQDQLKAFFERQESFNKRIEESLAAEQKERESGRGSSKRLPKALTVRKLNIRLM